MDNWLIDKADDICAWLQEKRGYSLPQILSALSLFSLVISAVLIIGAIIELGHSVFGTVYIFICSLIIYFCWFNPLLKEYKNHARLAKLEFTQDIYEYYLDKSSKCRWTQHIGRKIFIGISISLILFCLALWTFHISIFAMLVFITLIYAKCAYPRFPNVRQKEFEALPQGI